MCIDAIVRWFKKAVPEPTPKNFNTQVGCHIEEFVEMLETMESDIHNAEEYNFIISTMKTFSNRVKSGKIKLTIVDRVGFLDSVSDQIVTGVGAATFADMHPEGALLEVVSSNYSKFDERGEPIFDENQKIMKGPNYWKPNLERFV